MAAEIERKFLVTSDAWRAHVQRQATFRQGYLANGERSSVRVRIDGSEARLNIKSATLGVWRREYEYVIPLKDGEEMLEQLCVKPLIEKTRYYVAYKGHVWEIDEFEGDNEGLVVAEIELSSEDEVVEKPDWVGEEVSADVRYYNVSLVAHPYKYW